MPGKYSHGLVLAQYSAQGIISLHNDNYLRSSTPSRATSSIVFRERANSNTTHSSGFYSVSAKSAKSARSPQRRPHNLPGGGRPGTSKRVVIVSSDSESEQDTEESEEEWVRPQAKASVAHGVEVRGSHYVNPSRDSQPTYVRRVRQDVGATQPRPFSKTTSEPSVVEASKVCKEQHRPSPDGKKVVGARAMVQARYEAEVRKAAESSGQANEDTGLSLREILKTPAPPKEKTLTIQDFLKHVPGPPTDEHEASAQYISMKDPTPSPKYIGKPSAISLPQSVTSSFAYQQQFQRNCNGIPKALISAPSETYEAECNNGFSDSEEEPRFLFPQISTVEQRSQRLANTQTTLTRNRKNEVEHRPGPLHRAQRSRDAAASSERALHQSTNKPSVEPCKNKTDRDHVRGKSSVTSEDSDLSGIFGLPSVGGMTQATSSYSQASRSISRMDHSRKWDLPRLQQNDAGDTLGSLLYDIASTGIIFTSDEEEYDMERDQPAPRLQSILESDMFPARRWGTISARQITTNRARDADEMSNMSAIFPPDIGRYRPNDDEQSSLPIARSGRNEAVNGPRRTTSSGDKLKKQQKEGGLLQKLRKKVSS